MKNFQTQTWMLPDDVRPLLFNIEKFVDENFWDCFKIQIGVYAVHDDKGITHYPITIPVCQLMDCGIVETERIEDWCCWGNTKKQIELKVLNWLASMLDNEKLKERNGEYHWFNIIMHLQGYGVKITYPDFSPDDRIINVKLYDGENTYRTDSDTDTMIYLSVPNTTISEMADKLIEQMLIYEDLLGSKGYLYSFELYNKNGMTEEEQIKQNEMINKKIESELAIRRHLYNKSPYGKPIDWEMLIRKIDLYRNACDELYKESKNSANNSN